MHGVYRSWMAERALCINSLSALRRFVTTAVCSFSAQPITFSVQSLMSFLTPAQRVLLGAVSRLGSANPFLPERVECERAVLGSEFVEGEPVWSYRVEHPEPRANVWRIMERIAPVLEQLRARLSEGVEAREAD